MLEALSTYLSTQTILVLAAILIIALSFFLIGNMPRIVRWVLGQRLPQWIGNITLLLQFAVVAGEMAFFVYLLAPGSWKAWLTFAIVAVLAVLASVIFARFPIRRHDHEERVRQLAAGASSNGV